MIPSGIFNTCYDNSMKGALLLPIVGPLAGTGNPYVPFQSFVRHAPALSAIRVDRAVINGRLPTPDLCLY